MKFWLFFRLIDVVKLEMDPMNGSLKLEMGFISQRSYLPTYATDNVVNRTSTPVQIKRTEPIDNRHDVWPLHLRALAQYRDEVRLHSPTTIHCNDAPEIDKNSHRSRFSSETLKVIFGMFLKRFQPFWHLRLWMLLWKSKMNWSPFLVSIRL